LDPKCSPKVYILKAWSPGDGTRKEVETQGVEESRWRRRSLRNALDNRNIGTATSLLLPGYHVLTLVSFLKYHLMYFCFHSSVIILWFTSRGCVTLLN
jgi:hypothetical protein